MHKTANILNVLPKSVHGKAKDKHDLYAIYGARENRKAAEGAFDRFLAKYGAKYDKAAGCLSKDRESLLAFYNFPAEHWKHVRTSNPIESTFATVRLRTDKTKGCLSARRPWPWSSSSPSRPSAAGAAWTVRTGSLR